MRAGMAAAAILLLGACRGYFRTPDDCPAGYVPVDPGPYEGRAFSAAGVVIGAREFRNEEQAGAEFWATVIRKDLAEGKGFVLKSARDVGKGRGLLFVTPREKRNGYYVLVFAHPGGGVAFEAAGPLEAIERDLEALEAFLVRRVDG